MGKRRSSGKWAPGPNAHWARRGARARRATRRFLKRHRTALVGSAAAVGVAAALSYNKGEGYHRAAVHVSEGMRRAALVAGRPKGPNGSGGKTWAFNARNWNWHKAGHRRAVAYLATMRKMKKGMGRKFARQIGFNYRSPGTGLYRKMWS